MLIDFFFFFWFLKARTGEERKKVERRLKKREAQKKRKLQEAGIEYDFGNASYMSSGRKTPSSSS